MLPDQSFPVGEGSGNARVLVGDRVRVLKETPFTHAGPGTVAAVDAPGSLPIHVTLDDAEDPFDLIAVHRSEIEPLFNAREAAREANA